MRKLEPIAPTADESRKIEIPVGETLPYLIRNRYLVRMTVGQNEKSNTVIGCKINGQWFGFYGLKPGEQRQTLGPTAYNTPQPADSVDGKIVIEFNLKPSQPGAEWYVSEMELVAPVERIAARAGALVGTFPVADTLAWFEPDNGKLLEQVKVKNLRDVSLLDAQTALVISGDSVVKVGRNGNEHDSHHRPDRADASGVGCRQQDPVGCGRRHEPADQAVRCRLQVASRSGPSGRTETRALSAGGFPTRWRH